MVCNSDGATEWPLQTRIRIAQNRASALVAELAAQHAEIARVETEMRLDQETADSLEAQLNAEMEAEQHEQFLIEEEESKVALIRQRNSDLVTERKRLLRAIREQQERLGQTTITTDECIDVEIQCSGSRKKVERRVQVLRRSLQALGDQQADLAACENDERRQRRELRSRVREELQQEAEARAEFERRLLEREPELHSLRMRLQEAREAEQQALEEAQRVRREARRYESYYGPEQELLRAQLQLQLRALTSEDTQLHEELQRARERVWRKEQRKHDEHICRSTLGGG